MKNSSDSTSKFKLSKDNFINNLEDAKVNFTKAYPYIMTAIILFQIFLIIFPISFKLVIFTFLFSLFSFSILSSLTLDRMKELSYVGFKISTVLLLYNIFILLGKMLDNSEFSLASKKPFMFLLSTALSIALISFYIKKENREKIDENLLSLQGLRIILGGEKEECEEGDIVLCKDVDSGEDIILPFKDRFLHMLVLGPTGSGKTSQIIIPMIDQDMQNPDFGITVIEPKGDLAERVYAMAAHYGREAVYFNPTHPDCPYFNPLYGEEADVIENMATTFKMLSASEKSNPFFDNMNETLIRNALKLLKRLKGNTATLIDLSTIVYNSQGQGKVMVNQFARVKTKTVEEAKENGDIASWFLSDYYNERSKTYEHCSGLRSQVSKITSNEHLRRVLNPPNGENDVDFGSFIEEGKVLAISTAQGDLRDLGRFLGYFIILNLQSAVFKRPGNENTRRPHFLYIDEFQTYSNPGFADMLTQGRSYRVASHLATQNRALMAMGGGSDGSNFVELVSTNARNVVLFPGGNSKDAKYYSDEFGEALKKKRKVSMNRTKFSLLHSMKKTGPPSESISESEEMSTRFSASDLIYRPFGEVSYRLVKNNTVQAPGLGKVAWIPMDFNNHLTDMVDAYNEGVDIMEVGEFEKYIENIEKEEFDNEDLSEAIEAAEDPMDVVISFDSIDAEDPEDSDDDFDINIDPLSISDPLEHTGDDIDRGEDEERKEEEKKEQAETIRMNNMRKSNIIKPEDEVDISTNQKESSLDSEDNEIEKEVVEKEEDEDAIIDPLSHEDFDDLI